MLNFIMKLIMIPIVLIIAANLLTNLDYPYIYQPITIGVTLAVAGHLLEWAILKKETFWLTNIMDFVTTAIIIYFLSYFFPGAQFTVWGVLITTAVLTAIEFFVHMWLIRSGRARKEESYG